MKRLLSCLSLSLLSILAACASASHSQAARPRLVALGDLHGDLDAARRALHLVGALDARDHWSGGHLVVVQTGDQLDRGDQELELLDFFDRLATEAEKAGGKIHLLNGNHEIMNVQGDFRYVSAKGFQAFAQHPLPIPSQARAGLKGLPDFALQRALAFQPGGPYARRLASRKAVLIVGETVFVHGGLHPSHVDYGIDRLNRDYQQWLSGQLPQLPEVLIDPHSPIWSRAYSDPNTAPDCAQLAQTLKKLRVKRMVVGHSVQPEINSACEGQVWRIDVGMARSYGGPVQVLELTEPSPRVLAESAARAQ